MRERPYAVDRVLYTAYSARSLSSPKFRRLLQEAVEASGRSRSALLKDIASAWLRHDTYPMDYLFFRMWDLPDEQRGRYATTLDLYRYQRRVNDPRGSRRLRDKRVFRRVFADRMLNRSVDLEAADLEEVDSWFDEVAPDRVAVKDPLGQAGQSVKIMAAERAEAGWLLGGDPVDRVVQAERRAGRTLLEEGLEQHEQLAAIHPTSINTVRVITRIKANASVEIVSAVLRTGAGGAMDNYEAHGLSCPLDPMTGVVTGPLRSKGIVGDETYTHPLTGVGIDGLQIPFWDEVLDMVVESSLRVPNVRSIGWDVVIGPDGPGLIEGNENWCKTHWQRSEGQPKRDEVLSWIRDDVDGVSPWALSGSKRLFDIAAASFGLVVLSPVACVVSALVRRNLGSPVIFTQERPGLYSVPFTLHKFRTMTDDRDASGELRDGAERLTHLGRTLRRFSLDEIPELFDVLRGRMSLVGPRPLRLHYLPMYSPGQARRHLVKPGLTGLAQVEGRERLAWEQRFDADVSYVESCSFGMDLRIIWRTLAIALRGEDAEPEGGPLVAAFQGASDAQEPGSGRAGFPTTVVSG